MATARKRAARPRRKSAAAAQPINLALQGGGAHGAFTWGVLDALLADGRVGFEGISGSSAGGSSAISNAVASRVAAMSASPAVEA